jgi:carbamoyltransferase
MTNDAKVESIRQQARSATMNILGISAFYHDSAAALVQDGEIVAAAQEERFTRNKHDHEFPKQAIDYCLKEGGIDPESLDYVVFYDKPYLKFDRLLETYLAFAPAGRGSFFQALPLWLKQKLHLPKEIDKGLDEQFPPDKPLLFTEHHESHAASAFFPSPYQESALLTIDGVGEWCTTSIGHGRDNRIELTHEIHFPHSIGLLYSAFTYYTGFRVNSGEYKIMGLAPYGEPKYVKAIKDHLIDLRDDGSFHMNMDFFNYCQGLRMTNGQFDKAFGGPPREPESLVTQREMDLAASVQVVCEESMLGLARKAHAETGSKNLCLAGGVALNCVGNGKILRDGPFENIWIQPAAGDAGGALGGALFCWYQYLDNPRTIKNGTDSQKASWLGPRYTNDEIATFLKESGAVGTKYHDGDLGDRVADLMSQEQVIGWFHGRMEFGPRALGARSIIGDARSPAMQKTMNLKIKFRESFRPFAPCVLHDHVKEYFDLDCESPYMLIVAPVREDKRIKMTAEQERLFGIEKLNVPRSEIPAVTHVDYSARIQTVDPERHGTFHTLMQKFYEKTGNAVIVNTSFNIRGEPIVCRPSEAYRCFMFTHMDVLVLENYVLLKEDQPEMEGAEEYIKSFKLD